MQERLRTLLEREHGYLTPVHRLDRETAGLVIFALTKRAAGLLSQQFVASKVQKHYSATLWQPTVAESHQDTVWVDWIVKIPDEARVQIAAEGDPQAKRCQTAVRFGTAANFGETATIEVMLSPRSGRMHQLRVQAASRDMPIVGDPVYGRGANARGDDPETAADVGPMRLMATKLSFFHPTRGSAVTVEVPAALREVVNDGR